MERVTRNVPRSLDATFYVGETPTDATGAVTVDVTRESGDSLYASQATTNVGPGVYRYQLPAQTDLDVLTLTYTGTFSGDAQSQALTVEIVGGQLVTVAELRAEQGLADNTKFPLQDLLDIREAVEDFVEDYCGVAFRPRYARDVIDGDGTAELLLSRMRPVTIIDVTVDGDTVDPSGWYLYDDGRVVRDSGYFPTTARRNVEIRYEHGHPTPPADLRRAVARLARLWLLDANNAIPDRATSYRDEFGLVTIPRPGPNSPTAVGDIDRVLNAHRERAGSIA